MDVVERTRAWRADYSPIAGFYSRHWCSHYHPWAIGILDHLVLSRLPQGSRILDLCCGTGTLMRALRDRGFRVSGLDNSEGMLAEAHRLVPEAELLHADATDFRVPHPFDAVLCTFDSLNHILSHDELERVFRSVRRALAPGGSFVFDLTTDEAFLVGWQQTCAEVADTDAFLVRGRYDPESRLGETRVTVFREEGGWRRTDVSLFERCYAAHEVEPLLRHAGFVATRAFEPSRDAATNGPMALGRVFLVASTAAPRTAPVP